MTLRKGTSGVVNMILLSHAKIAIMPEFLKAFVEKERGSSGGIAPWPKEYLSLSKTEKSVTTKNSSDRGVLIIFYRDSNKKH